MNNEKIVDLINDAEEVLARSKAMFLENKSIYGQLSLAKTLINEAELLLKENTGAITESAHFANTKLGEVPLQADSSETGSVRQNEQTNEVNDIPEDCQSKLDGICNLPINSCKQCSH